MEEKDSEAIFAENQEEENEVLENSLDFPVQKSKLNQILSIVLVFNLSLVIILSVIVVILGLGIDVNKRFKKLEVKDPLVSSIESSEIYHVTEFKSENIVLSDMLNSKVHDMLEKYIIGLDADYTKLSNAIHFAKFSNTFDENIVNPIVKSYVITMKFEEMGKTSTLVINYNIDTRNLGIVTIDRVIKEDMMDAFKDVCKKIYNLDSPDLSNFVLYKEYMRVYSENLESSAVIKYDDIENYVTNNVLTSENLSNYYIIFKGEIDPTKPMLALTFDDGPYAPTTGRILDTLNKYGVKATFFVLGTRIDAYPDTIRKAIEQGCQIGNHTKNHMNLVSQSETVIREEINYVVRRLNEEFGYAPTVLRPPYGNRNDLVKAIAGMPLILWSVDTRDWESRNAESVRQEVLKYASDGEIILMHDIYASTADAVEMVVPELLKQGYQLVTVDELLKYKGKDVRAGDVIYNVK
ncbi:MAG: polysaccharide deacetylase family protein [Clostridia bacterium]|nr:polysaccharide deacetylase family protein [Clostridia bacterium]